MKQKLVFFLGGSKFSGAEKRIFLTALHISKLDVYDVVLFMHPALYESIESHDKFDKTCLNRSLQIKKDFYSQSLSSIRGFNTLFRTFFRLQALFYGRSVMHFCLFHSLDLFLARLSRFLGVRVFFEITSPDVAVSATTNKLLESAELSDGLICVSKNVLRICSERKTSEKVRLLLREHPFVDVKREYLSFFYKKNQVLFAHRLIDRKNPLLALDVFANLAKKHHDWQFVICGQGDLEEKVNQVVMALSLPNFVFKGYEVNMKARLQESKIFVSLIEPDNYPSQSVIEALASGCALLISKTGQSEDKFLSKQNVNGFAVNLDAVLIEEAIETMILSNQLELKCQNSISHFDDAFSLDAYLDESMSLYSKITNKE